MPTPCGLGLKFTVGTAVSVSPLGLLGGSSGSAGAAVQGRLRMKGGGGGGRGDKRTFFYFYIRDILNKMLTIVSPTFCAGNSTRRRMTYCNASFASRALV